MFAHSLNAADPYAHNPLATATECMVEGAESLKARAERYRHLAESLFDPKIIALVLGCARELEEYANAMIDRQTGPRCYERSGT